MKQQPDKFFSDKLGGFQLPSSGGAWDRIESNLDKKRNRVLWLKIAAAVMLVSIAFAALIVNKTIRTNEFITERGIEKPAPSSKSPGTEKQVTKDTTNTNAKTPVKAPILKKEKTQEKPVTKERIRKEGINAIRENTNTNLALNETDKTDSVVISPDVITEVSAIAIASQNSQEKDEEPSVKLVYAREQADKYLDKKSLADATTEQKKQSTLKKLLDKAYDLKHNQDPLGELRQKKDEILALNFKNDKQRSQNR